MCLPGIQTCFEISKTELMKNFMLTDCCIYTIKHSNDLENCIRDGGRGEFTEKKRWVTAASLFKKGNENGEWLPVIFAPAEHTHNLHGWAIIEKIALNEDGTTYSFSQYRKFPKRVEKTTLLKARDRMPLNELFIRPYAICFTPAFLGGPKVKAAQRRQKRKGLERLQADEVLSVIVGTKPLIRTELTKILWDYIAQNGLQDSKKKTLINADDALKAVSNGKSQVSMFEMTQLVAGHLVEYHS